jgi:hypothetical protein
MSTSPLFKPLSSTLSRRLFSLGLLSATSFFLEISLTRLFSTIFYPPYVFAVLSLAILGIGLGAALGTWRPGWRDYHHLPAYLIAAGGAALLLLLITVWGVLLLILAGGYWYSVPGPYLFVGLALVTYFSQQRQNIAPAFIRLTCWGPGSEFCWQYTVIELVRGAERGAAGCNIVLSDSVAGFL